MVIIVDTREQKPYDFGAILTEKCCLRAGDYSIQGLEQSIAVERKTVDDFVSSIIHERERFFAELSLLQAYDHACIVVESNLTDILAARYHSKTHPSSVLGTIVSIHLRFGIPVFLCDDRAGGQIFTLRYLKLAHERWSVR